MLVFRRWCFITLLSTILLIAIGGLVRSTGSGMGCPDWPKCFNCWVPPTNVQELPNGYEAKYIALRLKKNERVAKTLRALGFTETAEKIKNDPSVLEAEIFNATKTWIEYLNRLIGVLIGVFIFITVILAWRLRKTDMRLFWLSLAGLVGVGFEGFLGSIVVSTNLMPQFITVHMILAILLLLVLVVAWHLSKPTPTKIISETEIQKSKPLFYGGIALCSLVSVQIIMGTQVREGVDLVSRQLGEAQRADWVNHLPSVYNIHKLFYYLLLPLTLVWLYKMRELFKFQNVLKTQSFAVFSLLNTEIILGISMHRFAIPAFIQPLHLTIAVSLLAVLFAQTMNLNVTRK